MYGDYVNKALYADDAEVKAIGIAVQPELDRQRGLTELYFRRRWIRSSDEIGIRGLEGEYGIIPDLAAETLGDRKERLLELKRRREPFTEPWLNAEMFRRTDSDAIAARVEGLTLSVRIEAPFGAAGEAFISSRAVRELMPWLRGIVPANVFLRLHQVALPESYGSKKYIAGFSADKISETYASGRDIPATACIYAAGAYAERIEVEYHG